MVLVYSESAWKKLNSQIYFNFAFQSPLAFRPSKTNIEAPSDGDLCCRQDWRFNHVHIGWWLIDVDVAWLLLDDAMLALCTCAADDGWVDVVVQYKLDKLKSRTECCDHFEILWCKERVDIDNRGGSSLMRRGGCDLMWCDWVQRVSVYINFMRPCNEWCVGRVYAFHAMWPTRSALNVIYIVCIVLLIVPRWSLSDRWFFVWQHCQYQSVQLDYCTDQ